VRRQRPELVRLGYFGSYARGDAGVGSDLDLVAIVRECAEPFERRPIGWDLTRLPVPAEIIIYTGKEWEALQRRGGRFAWMLQDETVRL
jgi:predicted nucleotidyltransferase